MHPSRLSWFAIGAALLAACSSPSKHAGTGPTGGGGGGDTGGGGGGDTGGGAATSAVSLASVGLDADALDRTADPCDDFYQFACGGWIARTEIPADKPMAMRSFVDIDDRNREFLHGVLEQARTAPAGDAVMGPLGAYYGACMDEAAVEQAGTAPMAEFDKLLAGVKDGKTLADAAATLHAVGADALFTFGPAQDAKDARQVIGNLDQGGLGLPDRDYYLKNDFMTKGLRKAYRSYLVSLFVLDGKAEAAAGKAADQVIAVETELAKIAVDKVERRDPQKTYNRLDRAGVVKTAPRFAWDRYFAGIGAADVTAINVGSPAFLAGLDKLVAKTKPDAWRIYLRAHLLGAMAPLMNKAWDDAQFKFIGMLTGQTEQPARWKRCTDATVGALPDLAGQVFVRERFAGTAKQAAETQVHAISDAMRANLAALPWMDDATKQAANGKLDAMTYQIGYPKAWKPAPFTPTAAYAGNALAARRAEHARQLAKIGKPLDRDDWQMPASMVNAYYDPSLNGMVFPAGILQPPFFSATAAIPVNLGGMGVVVGHELTHGFDDQGAQYDAQGNLNNWWAPATGAEFKSRTQCVIDQYSAYEAVPDVHLNGANTVGENIADIGGVKLALRAYRGLRSGPAVVADGFTEDQQFFLGFGQAWCAKFRPEIAALLANVDPHSPAKWRVNGALSDTPEFAEAFGCKVGAKMRPANACQVW